MKKFTVYSLQKCKSFVASTVNCQLSTVNLSSGFTLIEVIVSTALFTIVTLVAVGALLSLAGANRKAQALHSVMDNLNISLDSMVRSIRMGSNYHCGYGNSAETQDCEEGQPIFAFESFNGDPDDTSDQWIYYYDADTKRIYKSVDNGTHVFAITAPSVTIESLQFYVKGTERGGIEQPKVVIEMKGTAGAENVKTKATFHIQSTAVQRVLDL